MIKWIFICLVAWIASTYRLPFKWARKRRLRYYSAFSTIPTSDFGCLKLIWDERHHLIPVEKDSFHKDNRTRVYQIADSDYYVVFYSSWLINLYRVESLEKLGNSYAIGGVSLKAKYNLPANVVLGGLIQRWYLNNNPMVSPSE